MKKHCIIVFLLLLCGCSSGDEVTSAWPSLGYIAGRVLGIANNGDSTYLANVRVQVDSNILIDSTDSAGRFRIKAASGFHTVTFTKPGYATTAAYGVAVLGTSDASTGIVRMYAVPTQSVVSAFIDKEYHDSVFFIDLKLDQDVDTSQIKYAKVILQAVDPQSGVSTEYAEGIGNYVSYNDASPYVSGYIGLVYDFFHFSYPVNGRLQSGKEYYAQISLLHGEPIYNPNTRLWESNAAGPLSAPFKIVLP